MMAKCLRCGATAEWIQGKPRKEASECAECVALQAELAAARDEILTLLAWQRLGKIENERLRALCAEAARHIDGTTGASKRPESDSGEMWERLCAAGRGEGGA